MRTVQVVASRLLTWSDFQAEGCPVYRERVSDLQPTAAIHPVSDEQLPFDVGSHS